MTISYNVYLLDTDGQYKIHSKHKEYFDACVSMRPFEGLLETVINDRYCFVSESINRKLMAPSGAISYFIIPEEEE